MNLIRYSCVTRGMNKVSVTARVNNIKQQKRKRKRKKIGNICDVVGKVSYY